MLLPPGTITRHGPLSSTAIDLVAGNDATASCLLRCAIEPAFDCDSDHLPILTVLDLRPQHKKQEERCAFQRLEPEKLCAAFAAAEAENPPAALDSAEALDAEAELLTALLQRAVSETVPLARASLHSVPWWTDELKKQVEESRRAKREAQRKVGDEEAAQRARNAERRKKVSVEKAKRQYNEFLLSQITVDSLWPSLKRLKGSSSATIPPLKRADGSLAVAFSEHRERERTSGSPPAPAPPPSRALPLASHSASGHTNRRRRRTTGAPRVRRR
ncbi:hypothetical protein JCM6882_002301 [Rhodosporidiobolus microsporus]